MNCDDVKVNSDVEVSNMEVSSLHVVSDNDSPMYEEFDLEAQSSPALPSNHSSPIYEPSGEDSSDALMPVMSQSSYLGKYFFTFMTKYHSIGFIVLKLYSSKNTCSQLTNNSSNSTIIFPLNFLELLL